MSRLHFVLHNAKSRHSFTAEVRSLTSRFSKQQSALESSLSAARREAGCLRVQLRNEEERNRPGSALALTSNKDANAKFMSLELQVRILYVAKLAF